MYKKWAESPISVKIDGCSTPREYHETNLVLLQIVFVLFASMKTLIFSCFDFVSKFT